MNDVIKELVKNNPGQMSVNEYITIYNILKDKGPCNFLVFGVGRDSQLWLDINKYGNTVFLENHEGWMNTIQNEINGIDIRKIEYTTDISEWKDIIDDADKLLLELDDDIINTTWDVILIDSPMGYVDKGVPGRMQSIYTASILNCGVYCLHDINRDVERVYGNKYLGVYKDIIGKLGVWM